MIQKKIIEKNIDCRKHRKSTHLASADFDAIKLDGKQLIFEIEECRYETEVNVNGKKQDHYFIKFKGIQKEWIVNSTNRNTISGFAKNKGFADESRYNIGNWNGLVIELYVDRNVKFQKKIVDGIRICPLQPKIKEKPKFNDSNFEKAKIAAATIEQIKKVYTITNEVEKKYNDYVTKD
tara:strand:- start:286 stop:822 length:537 start_codon:yes stop_codon:yes gene_type:complete